MNIIRIHQQGQSHTISVDPGQTLMAVLLNHGYKIPTPCAGNGTCKKCAVDTSQGVILACKTHTTDGMEIYLTNSNEGQLAISDTYETIRPITTGRSSGYGIAIDIGTTTLAFELVDMSTAKRIATHTAANSQRSLGADVITRIKHATQGASAKLHTYILDDIRQGVTQILVSNNIQANAIKFVSIAGNTTMLHILLDLPCDTLGVYPFTPVDIAMQHCSFNDVFGGGLLDAKLLILPGISTFVGADIVSGILCCHDPNNTSPNLLIDLGTNGEMALFTHERILVTSTAAGPAFEGGNISQGTAGIPGAIAKVRYSKENNVFIYETINNKLPLGICGTGVLDVAAELARHTICDETGYMEDDVLIADGVTFTQKDMREVQLAKSAVRSGIEILLEVGGYRYNDIARVYIAGGFGHKIDMNSAVAIGLIPAGLQVMAVGNTALGGAAHVLLSQVAEADAIALASRAEEINLSTHPRFNDLFMEHMMFNNS